MAINGGPKFNRRVGDTRRPEETDEEILDLIRDAKSDQEKAHLIVLYQINRNLIQNTNLTVDIVSRLQDQEKQMQAHRDLVTKGAGAWRALAFSLAGIGVMASYIWLGTAADVKNVMRENAEHAQAIGELRTNTPISREADKRLTLLEKAMAEVTGLQLDNRQRLTDLELSFRRVLEITAVNRVTRPPK